MTVGRVVAEFWCILLLFGWAKEKNVVNLVQCLVRLRSSSAVYACLRGLDSKG